MRQATASNYNNPMRPVIKINSLTAAVSIIAFYPTTTIQKAVETRISHRNALFYDR